MKSIQNFLEINNMELESIENGEKVLLHNPWGDSSLELEFSSTEDFSILENIQMPNKLLAIKHPDKYEFIYLPIYLASHKNIEPFVFSFEGKQYKAYYEEPTEAFRQIALSIRRRSYDETDYSNVFIFKRFYKDLIKDQEKEESERRSTGYKPLNFFLEGDFGNSFEENHLRIFRHINFYMLYYDRKSPFIYINNNYGSSEQKVFAEPNFGKIPNIIQATQIDDTLLLLIEAARTAQSLRLKYIFYYQVLEYCAYYYLDSSFKQRIQNIVGSPSFFVSMQDSINNLIEEFQSNYNTKNNTDSARMERVIETYCNYDSIKAELQANADYFCNDCKFDGGYILKPLLCEKTDLDKEPSNFYTNLRKRIEELRNVLVHVRESREDKAISPTDNNSNLLKPYLYLIRRIAEEIATNNCNKN